ncbi:EAL domain-containing protein [Paenibacillus silviterrae]|uniref:EAL domain-containing protein n=1 Tax=Paenibacillus silviterrae TaxID=3242194 RepID=UPI002543C5DB|nr:EAL domain-containing protein [Paenibacillus chinjuensis]
MQRINPKRFPAVDSVTILFVLSNVFLLFIANPFIQFLVDHYSYHGKDILKIGAVLRFLLFIINAVFFFYIVKRYNRKMLLEEKRLRASEEHYRLYARVFEASLEGILITDASSRIIAVNHSFTRTTGYTAEEVYGHTPSLLQSKKHSPEFYRAMWESIRQTGGWQGEVWNRRKDGTVFPEWLIINAVTDTKGEISNYVGIFSDISERKKVEEKLRMHARVFETSHEGIMITDTKGMILSVNPAFTSTTGYSEQEALGQTPRLLNSGRQTASFYQAMWKSIHETGSWQGEIWNKRKNGELYPEWLTIQAVKDAQDQVSNYVAIFTDITKRKQAEEKLTFLAHYDMLTGLPNRHHFHENFTAALQEAKSKGEQVGLLFIDLDRFKVINDTLGHEMGDRLLIQASHRLQDSVRLHHTVFRLGGDEFTVMMPQLQGSEEAAKVASGILRELARAFHIDEHDLHVTGSIGISIYPQDGDDLDTLLRNADSAMYSAKENKNDFQRFLPDSHGALAHRLELEQSLRGAMAKGQLEVYYQPQVRCRGGQLAGLEALVRWNHPQWGLVPPQEFIPVAEEIGMITEIDEWVIEEACAQSARWLRRFGRPVKIAVNLSAKTLYHPSMPQFIQACLSRYDVTPAMLEIELTESVGLRHFDAAEELVEELRNLGVLLSIDDFGTGHSALSYLKRLHFDVLKIDKSFIQDLEQDLTNITLVKAMVDMAHALQLTVVAEGVETEEQYILLRSISCDVIQGYLLSKPLPVAAIEPYLVHKLTNGKPASASSS